MKINIMSLPQYSQSSLVFGSQSSFPENTQLWVPGENTLTQTSWTSEARPLSQQSGLKQPEHLTFTQTSWTSDSFQFSQQSQLRPHEFDSVYEETTVVQEDLEAPGYVGGPTQQKKRQSDILCTHTTDGTNFGMNSIKLACAIANKMMISCADFFSLAQDGLEVYINSKKRKGPTLVVQPVNAYPLELQIPNFVSHSLNTGKAKAKFNAKLAKQRKDDLFRYQLRVVYAVHHLTLILFRFAMRNSPIILTHEECFYYIVQHLLTLCSGEDDCHKLLLKLVLAIKTMEPSEEKSSPAKSQHQLGEFLCNVWERREGGLATDIIDKIGNILEIAPDDPKIGKILVDLLDLVQRYGKKKVIRVREDTVCCEHPRITLQVSPRKVFRECVVAMAVAMCMVHHSTKEMLVEPLNACNAKAKAKRKRNKVEAPEVENNKANTEVSKVGHKKLEKRRRAEAVPSLSESDFGLEELPILRRITAGERARVGCALVCVGIHKEEQERKRANWQKENWPPTFPNSFVDIDSVRRLMEKAWIKDDVINAYFTEIKKADQRDYNQTTKRKTNGDRLCWFWPSHFFVNLAGGKTPYSHDNVRNWSQRVPTKNIFDLDKLLIPANVGNAHWFLCVVSFEDKQIFIYDSIRDDERCLRFQTHLLAFICDEYKYRNMGEEMQDKNEWKLPVNDAPQQRNSIDCGVFTVLFGVFLAGGYRKAMEEFASAVDNDEEHNKWTRRCRERLAVFAVSDPKE